MNSEFRIQNSEIFPFVATTETISLPTVEEFRSDLEQNYFADAVSFFTLASVSLVAMWLLLKTVG